MIGTIIVSKGGVKRPYAQEITGSISLGTCGFNFQLYTYGSKRAMVV